MTEATFMNDRDSKNLALKIYDAWMEYYLQLFSVWFDMASRFRTYLIAQEYEYNRNLLKLNEYENSDSST